MDEAMIRKRCIELTAGWLLDQGLVGLVHSVYRSAYADGLERAAKIAETPMGPLLSDFDDHWGPRIAKQIRQQAKEVGHDT